MRSTFFLAFIISSSGLAAEPMPEVPKNWKVELVAKAPEILYPTAIVVAPDGTIYLGQDPMDMPGPPTTPIDSVVAIKDGKIRVFADKLWAVMGLEWIDDTLYVVHAPFLSAFRDTDGDGKADQRMDLMTGLGPPLPGFSGINDHVPSGIRLGMDGFLYISFGDKGIPKGVGKDGTTIRVEGGGVIRIRPDGTGLEVVSTGERNPLSVALTATDEIFTYGNDDDSKKWPNSLTHHIVGGHYGYPYQFQDHPNRCLPIVAGQLGGSGTQGICYNEDGLPDSYRGNLFFCDWGLQTVFRYTVEKNGGTFRVTSKTPFVTKGDLPDFRPFSIAVSNDPSSFYLVDWAFNGWLADGPKTGRLFKMTYDGADRVKSSPPKTSGYTLKDLEHPSRNVRLAAQRAFSDGHRHGAVLAWSTKSSGPALGRINAMWALDASSWTEPGSPYEIKKGEWIRPLLTDKDAEVRLQAARRCGIRRDKEAVPALIALLRDTDATVRREVAIALGKIGDSSAAKPLYEALGDSDRFAEWSIEHAIRTLKAWNTNLLVSSLTDPKRRDAALNLTDEAWSVAVVDALIEALPKTKEPAVRAKIVENLAGLHLRYPDWSGHWFGTNPLAGTFPKKTKPWSTEGMSRVVFGLTQALDDADPSVGRQAILGLVAAGPAAGPPLLKRLPKEKDPGNKEALALALGRLHAAEAAPILAKWIADATVPKSVQLAALDALAQMPGKPSAMARFSLVFDKKADPEFIARLLPALGATGLLPMNDLADFLERPAPIIRRSAIATLVSLGKPAVGRLVLPKLDDPDLDVRKTAIAAVALLNARDAIPKLITLSKNEPLGREATLALTTMPDPRAFAVYIQAISDRNPDLRRAGERALLEIRGSVAGLLEKEMKQSKLPASALEAIERVLTQFAPILSWKVIGPFPRTTAPLFLGEKSLDLGRKHAGVEGRVVSWTERSSEPKTGRVVLDDFKGGNGDAGGFGYDTNGSPDLAAFAYTEIHSDRGRPALLLIGSSGSIAATLNEESILDFSKFSGRPYQPDSDRVRVVLKNGTNRLLVRTRQGIGSWSFSVQVSEPSSEMFAMKSSKPSLDELKSFAMSHNGDVSRGRTVFFDPKGVGCVKCHAAGGMGTANAGPDLTGLALKYDRAEIIRSVLEPSNRIATGYQPVLIAKTDGRVLYGVLKAENSEFIELIDADAQITRANKVEIDERRIGDVSIMPAGVVDTLSKEEFADLIAYLLSLKVSSRP